MQTKNLTRSSEDTKTTKIDFEPLSKEIVDCAFKIHQTIGSGLLECIYEDAFIIELEKRKIPYERQKIITVTYENIIMPSTFRLDLVIANQFVVELKSVEKIINPHTAQMLTYLKTSGYKKGFLINFGDPYFKTAVKRFII